MNNKHKSLNQELQIGDKVSGKIISLGKNGDGVLKHDSGIVVFVKGAKLNQSVEAEVTMVSHKFAIAIME